MELSYAYHEIEERLAKIDFPALFRGFCRFPFALYNDSQAYIDGKTIEKPAEFLGNTAIRYNGGYTAIWKLMEESYDFDVLASKIVHEMLHAFQNVSGEARWADERAAMIKYRYQEANFAARLEEAACMRKCLAGNEPEAFIRLLGLRKARMLRFPYEYDYEARIEQIEGTAHFVEQEALEQLNPEKAEKAREQMLEALSDPARYLPVRAVTYLSGAAFIACLRKYTDFDTDGFTDTPFSIAALAQAQPCDIPESDERVAACIAGWRKKTQDIIDRAIEKGDLILEGSYRLVAWNVYNAVWDGRYAVITAFAGYYEGDELPKLDEELLARMKIINCDCIAEVDADLRLTRVWRR